MYWNFVAIGGITRNQLDQLVSLSLLWLWECTDNSSHCYVDITRQVAWRRACKQNGFSIPPAFNGKAFAMIMNEIFVFTERRFINLLHTVIVSSFHISRNYSTSHGTLHSITYCNYTLFITKLRPPLWSSGQSSWLQMQGSWIRFPGTTKKK
jgi:hypothetical protein